MYATSLSAIQPTAAHVAERGTHGVVPDPRPPARPPEIPEPTPDPVPEPTPDPARDPEHPSERPEILPPVPPQLAEMDATATGHPPRTSAAPAFVKRPPTRGSDVFNRSGRVSLKGPTERAKQCISAQEHFSLS